MIAIKIVTYGVCHKPFETNILQHQHRNLITKVAVKYEKRPELKITCAQLVRYYGTYFKNSFYFFQIKTALSRVILC